MADLTRLNDDEQRELCDLLEDGPVTVPTMEWTVSVIGSDEPPRLVGSTYPPWWQGQDWWNQLPRKKQREYAARGCRR